VIEVNTGMMGGNWPVCGNGWREEH